MAANFSLTPFSSSSDDPLFSSAAASYPPLSGACGGGVDDVSEDDDACSICLDPFTAQDPATVTSCKHEYHLQCILDWSQRSKECPICWQLLALKDPASQELLTAVETERRLRSRNAAPYSTTNLSRMNQDFDMEQDSYSDDSDIEEHIMQHLAAAASRGRYAQRREIQRSSGLGPSQVLVFSSPEHIHNDQQTYTSSGFNSPASGITSGANLQALSSMALPVVNEVSGATVGRGGVLNDRRSPIETATAPGSSEMFSFSDSIKSKWFAASARYKESFSKSTRGIKEKLLARNNSVKELSKGVQREMSAGIAGVARMIERLDLTPKRTATSSPIGSFSGGTSNLSFKGKGIQDNIIAQTLARTNEGLSRGTDLDAPSHVCNGHLEVTPLQIGHRC